MARPISAPAVVEAYRDLRNVRKVAGTFRVGIRRVQDVLRAQGVELARRDKIDVFLAADLYRTGLSMAEVAARLGVGMSTIGSAFARHGIPARSLKEAMRLSERCIRAAEKRAEAARQAAQITVRKTRSPKAPRQGSARRVPHWVPRDLRTEYAEMTRLYGEHRAASEIRAMKAAAQ